jgi:hypothetical protein
VGLGGDLGSGGHVGLAVRPLRRKTEDVGEDMEPRRPLAAGGLIGLVTVAASVLLALTAQDAWRAATMHPGAFASFTLLTVALQLVAGLYGRGSISVAGIGMLGAGFTLGLGAAGVVAVVCAAAHFVRRRGRLHRAVFSAGTLALASAAGAGFYQLFEGDRAGAELRLGLALGAGALSWAVNIGLLSLVMSLSEGRRPFALWRGRFRWLTAHYLAFGPLALAATIVFEAVGVAGLVAFAVSPALLTVSVRRHLERRRAALDFGLS